MSRVLEFRVGGRGKVFLACSGAQLLSDRWFGLNLCQIHGFTLSFLAFGFRLVSQFAGLRT